jgi:ribose transport system ATP-binding protein
MSVPTSSSGDLAVDSSTDGSLRVALELSEVTRTFPGVRALDSVNLTVLGGEVHGVLGENGAGKSTLMAIASGALSPDEGTVTIQGTRLESADPTLARELGLAIVRQEPALLPDLTVAENLYLGVTPDRRPPPGRLQSWAVDQLQRWSPDVTVKPTDRVDQLQPMQRFIVEICRALSQDPDVLVLDEPTEHLLREEVDLLFRHVRERTARGKSVVYISHRINEVKEVTDRLTILRNGRSVGTYEAAETSESQIVSLIIGRDLDVYFPDKALATDAPAAVHLQGFSTEHVPAVSLDFAPGQIVGLAGIDGNGQRDFLRALGGVTRSSGTVVIDGSTYRRWGRRTAGRSNVHFLSGDRHNEGVLTGLSVRENIAYRGLPELATAGWVGRARETELAATVVAEHHVRVPALETPIESLSGGNQQKALIGSALASRPRVLLVDEPTQGVDIGARSDIYALMRQAAEDGTIVVVLCSDAAELAGIADRVLVFSRGHIIDDLTGDAVTERAITSAALASSVERTREVASTRRVSRWLAGDVAPFAVVAAFVACVVVIGAFANSRFLGSFNMNSVLMLTATLGFVAIGQVLVMLTGGIDVSAGPVVGLVANIASFYLIDLATTGTLVTGWVLMLGGALLVGLLNWTLIDVVRLSPLIATLTTYMGVQGVSFVLRPNPGGSISVTTTDAISRSLGAIPAAFVVVAVLAVVLEVVLRRRRPGIVVRAAGSREESARVNGIEVRRVRLLAYLGCSLCAAFAGILFMAQTGTGDPSGGVNLTLLSITAAVVGGTSVFGGRGSFVGALLGALLIQAISSLTVFLELSSDWQYYVIGALTLGAVALYSTARRRVRVS